jgi:hypothetical protein
MKAKKTIKDQNKKSLISSIFNTKSSINGNLITRKVCFSKILLKILRSITFAGKINNSAHSLVPTLYERCSFHP